MASIIKVLTCPCNPTHTYQSKSAFYTHKKSNRHKAWEFGQQSEKIEAKRRDDEIFTLNFKLKDREEQIEKLMIEKVKLLELRQDIPDLKNILNLCEQLKKENKKLKAENNAYKILVKKDV